MKVGTNNPANAYRTVSDLLNAPSVEELVEECEALVHELECRIRKAENDKKALTAARARALTAIPLLKPVSVRRRVRTIVSMTFASHPKGD